MNGITYPAELHEPLLDPDELHLPQTPTRADAKSPAPLDMQLVPRGLPTSPSSMLVASSVVYGTHGSSSHTRPSGERGSSVQDASSNGLAPLLDSSADPASGEYQLYRTRFWVVFVFCFVSFGQSMIWITYSPITKATEKYYGCSEASVDLLLNWGMVFYILFAPFCALWGSTAKGMRQLVVFAAWCEFAAVILRCIPELIAKETLHPYALWFLHPAHILNALACPPVAVTVTKLSSVWMGERERTSTTALAVLSNNIGTALGMLLYPQIVSVPDDMPTLLYIQAGFGVAILVCTLAYFPAMPPTHPSASAAEMFARPPEPFLPAVAQVGRNRNFLLLAVSAGLSTGIYNVWTSTLSTILPPDLYTDQQVGWLSFISVCTSMVGAIVMASFAQRAYWRSRLKALIVSQLIGAVICATLFQLLLPSVLSDSAVIPHVTVATLSVVMFFLGWFIGGAYPLAFELVAEITYPIPESVSGGVMSIITNGSGIPFLLIAPAAGGRVMNAVYVAFALLSALLAPLVAERYFRQEAEAAAAVENAENKQHREVAAEALLGQSKRVVSIGFDDGDDDGSAASAAYVAPQQTLLRSDTGGDVTPREGGAGAGAATPLPMADAERADDDDDNSAAGGWATPLAPAPAPVATRGTKGLHTQQQPKQSSSMTSPSSLLRHHPRSGNGQPAMVL